MPRTSTSRGWRFGLVAVALPLILLATLVTGDALGAPAGSPADVEEARTLMVEGNANLHAGKPAEALEKLERSYALVPSPNTELLVARALRELGRRVEAARAFEHAEQEARRRALAGEVKYGQTEAAAHTEGAAMRAQLGTLRVHVAHPDRMSLRVDGKDVALAVDGGDTTILHEPGRAEIVVREGETEQKQIVTVVPGTTIQMEFAGAGAKASTPGAAMREPTPRSVEPAPSRWTLPAALVAGGVTLLGGGTFAFFGSRSESTWDDLSRRCGPSFCGPAERADADAAKTDQTLANVGLVAGSVAAVATVAFVVLHLTSSPERRASLERRTAAGGLSFGR